MLDTASGWQSYYYWEGICPGRVQARGAGREGGSGGIFDGKRHGDCENTGTTEHGNTITLNEVPRSREKKVGAIRPKFHPCHAIPP
jgi:hypothetical protein